MRAIHSRPRTYLAGIGAVIITTLFVASPAGAAQASTDPAEPSWVSTASGPAYDSNWGAADHSDQIYEYEILT